MTQYIDKADVVAEIENYKNSIGEDGENCYYIVGKHKGQKLASEHFLSFIDTLEVKEVDLDKEMSEYFVEHPDEFFSDKYKLFAKHFFELGLEAHKD